MSKTTTGRALYAVHEGTCVLKLTGEVRVPMCGTLDQFIESMFAEPDLGSVVVDLSETRVIDSTALGLLAKIAIYFDKRFQSKPVLMSPNDDITRLLLSMGFPQIFDLRTQVASPPVPLQEVDAVPCTEENACDKVLEAHRLLMSLNAQNADTFRDVVAALEQAKAAHGCQCDEATPVFSRA